RSRKTIIEFVNQYFSHLLGKFSPQDSSQQSYFFFTKSYENMQQKAHQTEEGLVSFDFEILDKPKKENNDTPIEENDGETNLSRLVSWCKDKINTAQENGYTYSDIVILVRKNKTASVLANALLEQNIPIISEDALFVAGSPAIRLIIAALRFLVRPGDLNAILTFLHLYGEVFSCPIDADILKDFFEKLTSSNQSSPSLQEISEHTHSYEKKHPSFSLLWKLLEKRLYLFTLTLPDLGEEIIRLLSLSQQKNHYVFLAKLLDILREFSLKKTGSIADFLTAWDEEIALSLTIDPDSSANAVRIMSIHKAKGLEFPVVLFPLLSEKSRNDKDIIGPYPRLITQSFSDPSPSCWLYRVKETLKYVPEVDTVYNEERDLSLLDEVNILYVAFTRARDVLSVYVSFEETKKFSSFSPDTWKEDLKNFLREESENLQKHLGHLTLDLITTIYSSPPSPFTQHSDKRLSFCVGKWPQKNGANSPSPHETLATFFSSPWQKKIRVRRHEAEVHLLFHEEQRQRQEEGIIIHELLAHIFKESDIETIIKSYARTLPEKLSDTQQNELKDLLYDIWNIFVQKEWTEGFSIHNEETLLTPAGLIRPDKIFLSEDKKQAIVVDYKSGLQSENIDPESIQERYKTQLQIYCDAIKKMGYSNVEGYVLLISSRKLHKVV
ncbi:MAG: 3'-5' exonuclease, partial [Brevinematales bacterium]